jgi:hypothetical protein
MGLPLLTFALVLTSLSDVAPLDVRRGQCEAVLAPATHGYLVVVGSLAPWNHASIARVRAVASSSPVHLPVVHLGAGREQLERDAARLKQERPDALIQNGFTPALRPPARRIFYLPAMDRNVNHPDNHVPVDAALHTFNRCCQVYVDADEQRDLTSTVAEIVRCFSADILPWSNIHLGQAADVDRDGRFTIFLTGRLKPGVGPCETLDGFVRGSDFFLELPAPFSNRCDMMVLSNRLQPGRRLRTLLAHEFTHAVVFSGHALTTYPSGPRHQDEESWLGESLAHLVEEVRGFSRENIEPRVRAYLEAPEAFPIVVPDTFTAGLEREAGIRGGGLLFLKSVYDRQGPDLLFRLAQSNLRGVTNLEAASRERFEDAFRHFSVRLGQERWREGKATGAIGVEDGAAQSRLKGTTFAVFHISGRETRTRLTVEAGEDSALQVTLIRLDEGGMR